MDGDIGCDRTAVDGAWPYASRDPGRKLRYGGAAASLME